MAFYSYVQDLLSYENLLCVIFADKDILKTLTFLFNINVIVKCELVAMKPFMYDICG